MSSPPDLLYLPEDVLREILAHLLVDTPRAPERTAVIQMCQLLHDLGIPLLYRVVDLTGSRLRLSGVMRTLRVVFGSGGLLARSRREGSFVREIRLGSVRSVWDWGDQDSDSFEVGDLDLSRCTSLLVDLSSDLIGDRTFLPNLMPQITNLRHLRIAYHTFYHHSKPWRTLGSNTSFVNLIGGPAPSAPLETLTFTGAVLWDQVKYPGPASFHRLSLSDRAFKTLVVDLRESADNRETDSYRKSDEEEEADLEDAAIILDPLRSMPSQAGHFLPEVRRIELRVGSKLEGQLRTQTKKYEQAGLSVLQERILPPIVFIDDDGTERRVIEATEEIGKQK